MLAVAIVLRERVVLEHVRHVGVVQIDDVGLAAVLIVLFRAATVVTHLIKAAVNA